MVLDSYVVYTLQRAAEDAAERIVIHRVHSRDIKMLNMPPHAKDFYFFEAPQGMEDPLSHEINPSPVYLIAKEVWTAPQARAYLDNNEQYKRKCADTTLTESRNITKGQLYKAVWDAKIKSTPLHAFGEDGSLRPIYKDWIVIDKFKRVLHDPSRVVESPAPTGLTGEQRAQGRKMSIRRGPK